MIQKVCFLAIIILIERYRKPGRVIRHQNRNPIKNRTGKPFIPIQNPTGTEDGNDGTVGDSTDGVGTKGNNEKTAHPRLSPDTTRMMLVRFIRTWMMISRFPRRP